MEIIWTDFAVASLYDISEYVHYFFNDKIADDVTQKILSYVNTLSYSPKLGKRISSLSEYGEVRCAFYKKNHIYYRLFDNKIEIILVWDGRQDPCCLKSLLHKFFTNNKY